VGEDVPSSSVTTETTVDRSCTSSNSSHSAESCHLYTPPRRVCRRHFSDNTDCNDARHSVTFTNDEIISLSVWVTVSSLSDISGLRRPKNIKFGTKVASCMRMMSTLRSLEKVFLISNSNSKTVSSTAPPTIRVKTDGA